MEKYSIQTVIDIINSEGLGYAVKDYMSGENIADEKLAKLWDIATNALREIELYIEKQIGEDFEWE